jgi:hypothetical protein
MRFFSRTLSVAGLVYVLGCGLSDYEKRMDEQRDRMRAFDEEVLVLGDLIEMPYQLDAKNRKAPLIPFDTFLRMPKGVSGKFGGAGATYAYANQPLFRYSSNQTDFNVFVAGAKLLDKKSKTPPKDDQVAPDDFRFRVRGGLQDFFSRQHGVGLQIPDDVKFKKEKRAAFRKGAMRQLQFESLEIEDPRVQNPSKLFIYFHDWVDRQAAIIYQVPKVKADATFTKTMDISLKTLEISPLASQLRSAFRK